jgi:gas vesicle protein
MSSSSDKVLCFLLGASVGSIVALLYAPRSGRETRDDLTRRANDGREFITRKVDEGRHFVEEGGKRVSSEVTSMVERGKSEVEEFVDKGRGVVKRQKEQVAAAFEAGKEAYRHDKAAKDTAD